MACGVLHRAPWKIVLPVLMIPVTIALSRLDDVWMAGAGKWDDLPVASAQGLSALMNGPISQFFGFRTPAQWILIGIFWAWVGWLFDRRMTGIRTAVIRHRGTRRGFYAVGFALGAMLLFIAVTETRFTSYYYYLLR